MLRVKPQSPCRTLLLESLEIRRLLATDLRADAFQNELLQGLSSLPSIDFPQAILLNIDSRKPSTSDSNAIHDEPPLVPELRDRREDLWGTPLIFVTFGGHHLFSGGGCEQDWKFLF